LFIGYKIFRGDKKHWVKYALIILGIMGLVFSLCLFFSNDRMRYNHATFEQSIPILSLILFALCILSGILVNVVALWHELSPRSAPPPSLV